LDQNGLRVAHPSTGGQRVDPGTLDRGLEGEVEILEGLANRQIGQSQRGLHPPLLAPRQLGQQQPVEERVRWHLLAHRLGQQWIQLLGRVGAAQGQQALPCRVDVEPRPPGAHRATSASAA